MQISNVRNRILALTTKPAMSPDAEKILDEWQAITGMNAERTISKLLATADELTTLSHSREGAHTIRGNLPRLKLALIKLHDLALDAST